jgi:hypothetical protein
MKKLKNVVSKEKKKEIGKKVEVIEGFGEVVKIMEK